MKREGQIQVHSENIFPIIKKWLYSDKDIFLRELVSNGCDAISKLKKLEMMGEAPKTEATPRLEVVIDKDSKTLTITDNGLGMTEEEVEKYITQVAFSGAEEFIQRYKEKSGDADAGIIGHFGLGFYSAFMVSDRVEIETLSYQENAKGVRWTSTGESTYELEDCDRTEVGTKVTLHISEEEKEFLEEGRIREIMRRYCSFMPYEIFLNPKGTEEDKPFNNTTPLWQKAPKDCTEEEYIQFYQQVFMDFEKPLFWIHLNVDYPFNLKGILYFPKLSSKVEVMPGEIKLYCNQVYVADNIKEVIPEFLMLLKGVIDCPDIPLNVSRSFLQNSGDVQKISAHITKKVSDKLHSIFSEDRETYVKYWDDIAPFIKFGCLKDEKFYDRVKDIILFKTINDEYFTMAEYPKQDEKEIFYVTDPNLQARYIKMFKENGLNAVVLNHAFDQHFISFLEYKEQGEKEEDDKVKFTRIDSQIASSLKKDGGENSITEEEKNKILDCFKEKVGIEELTVTGEYLSDSQSPAILLLSEFERRMQEMGSLYGTGFGGFQAKASVVLNLSSGLVRDIPALSSEKAELVCKHIYDLALLSQRPLVAEEMDSFISHSLTLLKMVQDK